MPQDPQSQINQLKQELDALKSIVYNHQHTLGDGTTPLRKTIILDRDQWLAVGVSQMITGNPVRQGQQSETYNLSVSVGPDPVTTGFVYKSQNMQMDFYHQPNDVFSFLRLYRSPAVVSLQGTTINTTNGGTTTTITGFNFATDELQGALINIFNAAGDLVETQTISSNTPTVVTIVGTWLNTTTAGTFIIYRPIYLGSAEIVLQRAYVQEGNVGGLRFGNGPTAGGQNGLLFMDAAGDLFWRNKAGTVTQLN